MEKKICLNLSTLDSLDFESQLRISAQAGFNAVGLRDHKVKEYLSQGKKPSDIGKLLATHGLSSIEYDFFPNWAYCHDNEREEMLERLESFSAVAQAMGEESILVTPVSFEKRNDVSNPHLAALNLKEMSKIVASHGNRIAIEFLPWTRIDSARKVWEIVREVNLDNVGIVLDSFHYFEGPSTKQQLSEIPIEKIFLVHLNDLKETEGDLLTLTREFRVLPGEGRYKFDEILSILENKGYTGYYSLEIMNKSYAARDSLELAKDSMRSICRLLEG